MSDTPTTQPAMEGGGERTYWISWYQPGPDYRPITFPPPEFILGWWCSGETCAEPAQYTLVAHVLAGTPEAARSLIEQPSCWPDAGAARFCEERPRAYTPGDRFPLSDWMKPRYSALRAVGAGKGEAER